MKLTRWFGVIAGPILLVGMALPVIAKADTTQGRLASQHFFCNTGYTLDACLAQITTLRSVVANFPTQALGEWTWVLVRSQDWKQLTKMLGLNPNSPGFTCFETRTTFIEETLVAPVAGRAGELISRWHLGMRDLLDYTVGHEIGHGVCNSRNEDKANHIAAQLQQKKSLACQSGL